ncbi:hypothetical protein YTPLAS18_09980 [Nitrospira sp.]|nr:hypothetical protein YTPLAS18_09980 [Nitrospira sp.]
MLSGCVAASLCACLGTLLLLVNARAQAPEDVHVTTERSCSFMMQKGEPGQQCEVPLVQGCVIANFPGTKKPWTTISKGGKTTCQFDPKKTDWKTRVVGTCTKCTTEQCSASFAVKLDCTPG